jgi:hypothetical protein
MGPQAAGAVLAIRPGRPWPTQILAWPTQTYFWPTLAVGLPKESGWKYNVNVYVNKLTMNCYDINIKLIGLTLKRCDCDCDRFVSIATRLSSIDRQAILGLHKSQQWRFSVERYKDRSTKFEMTSFS